MLLSPPSRRRSDRLPLSPSPSDLIAAVTTRATMQSMSSSTAHGRFSPAVLSRSSPPPDSLRRSALSAQMVVNQQGTVRTALSDVASTHVVRHDHLVVFDGGTLGSGLVRRSGRMWPVGASPPVVKRVCCRFGFRLERPARWTPANRNLPPRSWVDVVGHAGWVTMTRQCFAAPAADGGGQDDQRDPPGMVNDHGCDVAQHRCPSVRGSSTSWPRQLRRVAKLPMCRGSAAGLSRSHPFSLPVEISHLSRRRAR